MANYILLERIELNASAASVTFANIPQTGYTDLKLVWSARGTNADPVEFVDIALNGSSTSFTSRFLRGRGTGTPDSYTDTTLVTQANGANATASTFSNGEFYFPNYLSTTAKSFSMDGVTENNATSADAVLGAGLWNPSTQAAINSIKLTVSGSRVFVQYSTFSLYGLAAVGTTPAIAPKAAGGNRIDYDGTYWYHTFLATGAFVPQVGLTCDALVVAGGGGGGAYAGGGGGAGGLLGFASQSFASATSYTVTVGAGGTGGGNSGGGTGYGSNGTDSQLGTLTLVKGGGGGGSNKSGAVTAGANGGSGGGGSAVATSGGTATSGQGFNGANYASSGGGGGGGSAEAGNTDGAYLGGDGLSTYSSWGLATVTGQNISGTVYYAGGGNSDSAGASNGGDGGGGKSSTNGLVNTGGGGGGWDGSGSAGNGGAGIVIIRYLAA
jgi:hypothetical protein